MRVFAKINQLHTSLHRQNSFILVVLVIRYTQSTPIVIDLLKPAIVVNINAKMSTVNAFIVTVMEIYI